MNRRATKPATQRAQSARAQVAQARRTSGRARPDPQNRPTDGIQGRFYLRNRHPDYHYVWVNKNDEQGGKDFYEEVLGYEVCIREADGVQPFMSATKEVGQPIETRELILMRIHNDLKRELDQYGADGRGGYQWADTIRDFMSRQKNGIGHKQLINDGNTAYEQGYLNVSEEGTTPEKFVEAN